ncbi:hypothetical protein BUALT_Bualt04G0084500 [Buddleja alternifolia]|uniref:GRF-type domain-containing protein n=1 Tax=Buddleja alternifolia TaxID=168488 RepID=A0AAV6XY62_9LAMI|nr:hypothetical protein BUALT_Bualt04G0084500 [Buddleja alternifolia]
MAVNICHCRRLARIRCSWTDANPGRRFYGCDTNRDEGGCGFFVWLDPPMCERSRNVIPGLLRSVNRLQAELETARQRENRERRAWTGLVLAWVVFLLIWMGTSEKNDP